MKYKAVENTLMRIRNKLTNYKNKDKRIKRSDEIEFTDEEKNLLESVIDNIEKEALEESASTRMDISVDEEEE